MDLDGDGRLDVMSGSWPGELYFFRRLADGTFAAGEPIKDRESKAINLGCASTVFAGDWDGDDKLDLLVGSIDGYVYLVPNEGAGLSAAFGTPRQLEADGALIKVSRGDSHPVLADWNRDGRPDLIVGTGAGSVLWYRNVGTRQRPKLATARTLVPESVLCQDYQAKLNDGQWGTRAKICVTDWNRDGWPDLLLGDCADTFFGEIEQSDAEKVAVELARKRVPELMKRWAVALQEYRVGQKSAASETATERETRESKAKYALESITALKREIDLAQTTVKNAEPQSQLHGRVWLFLRHPLITRPSQR